MSDQNKFMSALNQLKAGVSELEKSLTEYHGEKVDSPQDGNVGSANGEGQVDYEKFDNLAKKNLLKQKMLAGN